MCARCHDVLPPMCKCRNCPPDEAYSRQRRPCDKECILAICKLLSLVSSSISLAMQFFDKTMFEKILKFKPEYFSACMALVLVSPATHAGIYKWVDADGKTHYSDNKEAAGQAQVEELKLKSAPPAPRAIVQSWQEKENEFKVRQIQKNNQIPQQTPVSAKARRSSYPGNQPETDKSRCDLAREVKSGAVKHRNGARTDNNDLEIADRDIRAFCR